jgi:hypothetical protein
MSEILHAIDRALIHIFSSMGCMTSVYFFVTFVARRKSQWWFVPKMLSLQLLLSAVLVLFVAICREPFDVWADGPVWKSYTDIASWCIGLIASYIGTKRLVVLDWR